MANAVSWFDIPATDLARAATFYGTVLNTTLECVDMGNNAMAIFPHTMGSHVGGALVQGETHVPSDKGSVVYIECGDDLQPALDRVEGAGGTILAPKTDIGNGCIAYIIDTEGNRVGLHSTH